MIKKFSFWMISLLLISMGVIGWTHFKSLETLRQKPAAMEVLFQKQKIIAGLELSLEKYRRLSTSFRKASQEEMDQAKAHLRGAYSKGLASLAQMSPSPDEEALEKQAGSQITELFNQIAQVEPSFFSKDAYNNAEVQALHDQMVKTLRGLDRSFDAQMKAIGNSAEGSSAQKMELQPLISFAAAGGLIIILMIASLLRTYFSYTRPLKKLRDYAIALNEGKPAPAKTPEFSGPMGEIQKVVQQLSNGVETFKRDRHKFLLDVVTDLKGPLKLLQAGKRLVGNSQSPGSAENPELQLNEIQAAESVRRGLAMISGSLDDLNDIVDINLVDSRLAENTVDLSEMLSDSARMVAGADFTRKIMVSAPPIPVWAKLDTHRMVRVVVLVLSKIMDSSSSQNSGISVQLSLVNQSSFRGIEILFREFDQKKPSASSKLPAAGGPEQDILRHWLSENGLGMLLAQKIVKAHGGALVAAGVAGGSVSVTLRLPQERVISHGLVSPPGLTGSILGVRSAEAAQEPHQAKA